MSRRGSTDVGRKLKSDADTLEQKSDEVIDHLFDRIDRLEDTVSNPSRRGSVASASNVPVSTITEELAIPMIISAAAGQMPAVRFPDAPSSSWKPVDPDYVLFQSVGW